ncbi:MAG: glutamate--tRNA ligase [archaeon]
MKLLKNYMRAYALRNALEHDNAIVGKVLPKLFNHRLKKEDIRKIMPQLNEIIKEVNSLSKEEKEKEFSKLENLIPKREEKKNELSELPNVKKKMVFRAAPYPSGALHIGNAKTFLINALYAEKYKGKMILVMDDTIGSEEKQIDEEAYKLIEDAFAFLKIKYSKPIVYKSDRLDIYYKHALKLIEREKVYVCFCSQEAFKKLKDSKKDCPCRNVDGHENRSRWYAMFKAEPGKAVLRIKTSMQNSNPAFRDRVLFKISEREHPRVGKKFRVWPTLEMSWAVDDHLLGITHIIRGEDLRIETEMEKFIWDIFNWEHPETIHTGLVNLEGLGVKISKSKSQKEVKSGKFFGWDDPRTWSIQSLERRGIRAEAIRQFVKDIGLNKQNITAPIETIYSLNRGLIDKSSNRYFFVEKPKKIKIKHGHHEGVVEIPLHPDEPTRGYRKFRVKDEFYVQDKIERGKNYRLMHLFNFCNGEFVSHELDETLKAKMIHWLPVSGNLVKVKIVLADGKIADGLAESGVENVKVGEVIQFERFGFVRLDKKTKDGLEFWWAHK